MSFWTKDREAELRSLTAERYSARDVAKIFGCSRNAVIGKRNRLGIESILTSGPHRRPIAAKPPKKLKDASKAKAAPVTAPEHAQAPPAVLAPIEELFVDTPTGAAEAVFALRHDSCRWPTGHPLADDFRFCMAQRSVGATYCAEHEIASRGMGTISERNSLKAALRAS